MGSIKASQWAIAPVELLTGNLSMKARLCYVVMRSFGPESKASISAIAFRMGIDSENTVREAQKELISSGWIKLVSEGQAGGKGRPGIPRAWEIADRVLETITLDRLRVQENNTRNRERNQSEKEDIKNQSENSAEPSAWRDLIDTYFQLFQNHPSNPDHKKPMVAAKDFGNLKNLLKRGATHAEIKAVMPAFFADAFAQRQGFALSELARQFNALRLAGNGQAPSRSGRAYYDPGCDPLEPGEGQ